MLIGAGIDGRAVQGVGCDRSLVETAGFEFRMGHGCLFLPHVVSCAGTDL